VKYFKGNSFTNGAMIGLADLMAAIILRFAQNYISTKRGFLFSYSWVFVFTLVYLCFKDIVFLIPFIIL